MATAEPQVEQVVGQPQGTEYVQISDHEIKCINTNFPVVSVQQNDSTTDVNIKVGAENFKAHRRVLLAACKYFSPDMKENEVVELKDISSKGFTALLEYFYNGFVIVNPDNIEELIEGARFFHIEWLLDVCCDFLVQHLSLVNYPVVMQLSEKYWLGDLRWDIFVFLGQNLPDLCQQENFYDNLALELLLQFLMENVYCEATEIFVLEVVCNWVKANEKDRKSELLALLRQIRFPTMEPEELKMIPRNVLQFQEIKEAIEDAENYSLNIMCQCLKNDSMYQQRGAKPVVAMLSFLEEGNIMVYRDPTKPTLFVEELGPTGIETVVYQTMSQAKIGNFLYAAGGYDGMYQSTAQVFRFDPKYRSWTEIAPMNESRVSFAMCNSDTKLYSVGGMSRLLVDEEETEKVHSSVEVYNPEENTWTQLPPLSKKTFDLAAEFHNGRLYVSGGISSESTDPMPLNTMWCLDVDGTDGWIQKQNMINGRQGHSMTAYKDKLYAVGGYTTMEDGLTFKDQWKNEVFDMETGQWTEIASTPEDFGRLFRYSGILCDKLFTIGGNNSSANLYMYDPETDAWELVDEIGPNVQKLAILNVAYPNS